MSVNRNESVYGLAESIVASGLPMVEEYDAETEYWAPIKGFEDYEISTFGRVRSNLFGKQRILKAYSYNSVRCCYYHVSLHGKPRYIHRLVAEAFIANPHNYPQVNHIDQNKKNNHVNNLEWCSNIYNVRYSMTDERRRICIERFKHYAEKHGNPGARWNKEHRSKPVIGLVDGIVVFQFPSIEEAGRQLGLCASSISKCARHAKTKQGYYYKHMGRFNGRPIEWRYENESH